MVTEGPNGSGRAMGTRARWARVAGGPRTARSSRGAQRHGATTWRMVPWLLPRAVSTWTSQASTWGSSQPKGRAGDVRGGKCCSSQKCRWGWAACCVRGPGSGVGATTQISGPGCLSLPLTQGPKDALERKGAGGGARLQGPLAGRGASVAAATKHSSAEALLCTGVRNSRGEGVGPAVALVWEGGKGRGHPS